MNNPFNLDIYLVDYYPPATDRWIYGGYRTHPAVHIVDKHSSIYPAVHVVDKHSSIYPAVHIVDKHSSIYPAVHVVDKHSSIYPAVHVVDKHSNVQNTTTSVLLKNYCTVRTRKTRN